jgi:hypothetical protein
MDGLKEFAMAGEEVVAEADEGFVGYGTTAHAEEFLDTVGFAAGTLPGSKAEEAGGRRAADAAAAMDEENAIFVGQ